VRIRRIVSGGQAGADRGALDAALALGRPYAGWCPAGGLAEDRPDPPGLLASYPGLTETSSADAAERTERNVRDSDATLVVRADGVGSPGTDLTVATARRLGRPCLVTTGDAEAVRRWLATLGEDLVLNVAGPRASEQPDAYVRTRSLVEEILRGDR
jgi:hypothetical protein